MRKFACSVILCLALAFPAASRPISDAEVKEIEDFAIGNVVWVLYHEIGHFLINEFNLPVLGREEDAVDNLATVILLEGRSAVRDSFLIASVDAFFLLGDVSGGQEMFEGHGFDEQRAFQVACLMYGSDPQAFGPFADTVKLPASRRETCRYEYERARSSWFAVLGPYRASGWTQASIPVVVDYADTANLRNAEIARILYRAQVLEVAAKYVSENFALRTQPTLRIESCNRANAYYEPATRTVSVCYELFESFHGLLKHHYSIN